MGVLGEDWNYLVEGVGSTGNNQCARQGPLWAHLCLFFRLHIFSEGTLPLPLKPSNVIAGRTKEKREGVENCLEIPGFFLSFDNTSF